MKNKNWHIVKLFKKYQVLLDKILQISQDLLETDLKKDLNLIQEMLRYRHNIYSKAEIIFFKIEKMIENDKKPFAQFIKNNDITLNKIAHVSSIFIQQVSEEQQEIYSSLTQTSHHREALQGYKTPYFTKKNNYFNGKF